MTNLFREVGYLVLLYLPVGVLVLWFYLKSRKPKSESVAPFHELKRRPAGESNRLRIEQLDEKIDPWLMTIVTFPILLAVWLMLTKPSLAIVILLFIFSSISCVTTYGRLRPLLRTRACYHLGLQGSDMWLKS
jgi:hypothetical protein